MCFGVGWVENFFHRANKLHHPRPTNSPRQGIELGLARCQAHQLVYGSWARTTNHCHRKTENRLLQPCSFSFFFCHHFKRPNQEKCNPSVTNYRSFDFFDPKFDHSSYPKICAKYITSFVVACFINTSSSRTT